MPVRGLVQQRFHDVGACFVPEIGNQRETIEDESGHSALLPELFLLCYTPPTILGTTFRPVSF